MDATHFAIAKTERLDDNREMITYAAEGYEGPALIVITTDRDGGRVLADIFFWRVSDPLIGLGTRDRVCDVSLEKHYGRWTAEMNGPSFSLATADGAKAFLGAIEVASAWFGLVRAEADYQNRGLADA